MYETLATSILKENFHNYEKCEPFWRQVPDDVAMTLLATAYQVTVETGEPREYLKREKALAYLSQGKSLSLPGFMLREHNDLPKCPRCGNSIPKGTAALSRRDNETNVCDDCGTKEALEDYFNSRTE